MLGKRMLPFWILTSPLHTWVYTLLLDERIRSYTTRNLYCVRHYWWRHRSPTLHERCPINLNIDVRFHSVVSLKQSRQKQDVPPKYENFLETPYLRSSSHLSKFLLLLHWTSLFSPGLFFETPGSVTVTFLFSSIWFSVKPSYCPHKTNGLLISHSFIPHYFHWDFRNQTRKVIYLSLQWLFPYRPNLSLFEQSPLRTIRESWRPFVVL